LFQEQNIIAQDAADIKVMFLMTVLYQQVKDIVITALL
jgi:hypothetical protein